MVRGRILPEVAYRQGNSNKMHRFVESVSLVLGIHEGFCVYNLTISTELEMVGMHDLHTLWPLTCLLGF